MELKREKSKCMDDKHYVVKKDYEKELERVNKMYAELKAHERMSLAEAHPIPSLRRK